MPSTWPWGSASSACCWCCAGAGARQAGWRGRCRSPACTGRWSTWCGSSCSPVCICCGTEPEEPMDDIRAGLHARLLSYAILLALLAINVTLAQLPLGRAGTTAQLVIAGLMAFIVIWVFMQVGDASGLVRTFAGASLLWQALMFVFTLTDYLAR